MNRDGEYFSLTSEAKPGDRYFYVADGQKPVPDPVSRLLPEGVHGRTEIVDPDVFTWTDQRWRGLALNDYIIYELHVGTFTPAGTFDGVIEKLDYLKNLGVTVIELMPVAAFPGERNWGYDGVSLYAVQASYGGPEGLKRLVNAAHARGLAVILDVVYNHLGNEGNYLRMFAPYFTSRHKTPWGDAVDYSRAGVREFFVQNALYWIREYHLDGLRLDAVQTIYDDSPRNILLDIQDNVQQLARELGREVGVIAESDENDTKLIRQYGLDAMWSDDFHHAVHAHLTCESSGYYQDFGQLEKVARALQEGYVFQGEFFNFWRRKRGTPARDISLPANVICLQNHDQVGNRAFGERLTQLVPSMVRRQAVAALLLLAPHTPLLFMGQEFDETAPFQFFTSFGDEELIAAMREGRRAEHTGETLRRRSGEALVPHDFSKVPDPQDPETFKRSRVHWDLANDKNVMLSWYRALIELRKKHVWSGDRTCFAISGEGWMRMGVPALDSKVLVEVNFQSSALSEIAGWERMLYAAEEKAAVGVWVRE